jgi:hypothetical protein
MKRDPQENESKKEAVIKAAGTEAWHSMEHDRTINLDGACHIL